MKHSIRPCIAFMVLTLTGLGPLPAFAITSGQVVSASNPVLKFMVATFTSNADTGEREACSATLVQQRVVLTAAHCIVGSDVQFVTFGPERGNLDSPSKIEIEKVLIHPKYKASKNLEGDLALVRLAQPAPAALQPVVLASNNTISALPKNAAVQIAGYGRSEIALEDYPEVSELKDSEFAKLSKQGLIVCKDPSHKRGCQTPTSRPADGKLRTRSTSLAALVAKDKTFLIRPSSSEPSNVLKGDSGGPAFLLDKDQMIQIGVASYATALASKTTPSAYTNIVYYKSWIESGIASLTK